MNKIKNLIVDLLLEKSILEGMTYDEVRGYFGREPDVTNDDEWIYFIEKILFRSIDKEIVSLVP